MKNVNTRRAEAMLRHAERAAARARREAEVVAAEAEGTDDEAEATELLDATVALEEQASAARAKVKRPKEPTADAPKSGGGKK